MSKYKKTNGHKNCLISVSVWDQAEGRNRASINLGREKKNKINNRYRQLESTLGQIMGVQQLTLGGLWPTAIAPESQWSTGLLGVCSPAPTNWLD